MEYRALRCLHRTKKRQPYGRASRTCWEHGLSDPRTLIALVVFDEMYGVLPPCEPAEQASAGVSIAHAVLLRPRDTLTLICEPMTRSELRATTGGNEGAAAEVVAAL